MLDYEKTRQTLTVRLSEDLDHSAASRLRPELDALLKDPSIRRLVLDLKQLRFMDSSGIGVLLNRYKQIKSGGGTVCFYGACPQVLRVLRIGGMMSLMNQYESKEEAIYRQEV